MVSTEPQPRCPTDPFPLAPLLPLRQMDDAWAESVAPGCGGLAGLRAQLVEAQHKETDAETHKRIEDALLTAGAASWAGQGSVRLGEQMGWECWGRGARYCRKGGYLPGGVGGGGKGWD